MAEGTSVQFCFIFSTLVHDYSGNHIHIKRFQLPGCRRPYFCIYVSSACKHTGSKETLQKKAIGRVIRGALLLISLFFIEYVHYESCGSCKYNPPKMRVDN